MRVPDKLLECVVYIGTDVSGEKPGELLQEYAGTGFYVALPSARLPDISFTYLVTAAHVAESVEGSFWIRQNIEGGSAVPIAPYSGAKWFFHPDGTTVDVAVMPWPLPTELGHVAIPPEIMLVDRAAFSKYGVGVGDEVFLMGLFAPAYGIKRNTPMVRKGNIAMLPDDKIRTDKGEMDAYLIEAHSLGGLSGSPVFARETLSVPITVRYRDEPEKAVERQLHGAGAHYLLGLMHGHWEIDKRDVNARRLRRPVKGEPGFHLGLSVVVPASRIIETLNHPILKNARARGEERVMREGLVPTPDSLGGGIDADRPAERNPERLKIDMDFDDAARKLARTPRPEGGFPKPKGARRKKKG